MTRENDAAAVAGDGAMVGPACAMVIFGAAGDLTKRLVVPSLYDLVRAKRLPERFQLVGVDLAAKTAADWSQSLSETMGEFVAQSGGEFHVDQLDRVAWRWLTDRMTYLQGDLNDPGTYRRLGDHLAGLDKKVGTAGNYLFYLAVADRFFSVAVSGLGAAGLVDEKQGQWRRVVIEKQNVMALRFANGIFEPMHIDHIQITAAETVGVERRGKFYERTGALRDMVPNHLFQLLAMTAMEPPISFDADAVRAKKAEVIQAIRPMSEAEALQNAVRGQYAAGTVLGKPVQAYRAEPDVAPDSTTETFIACRLNIDNWRWAGVPFYLRTGKYVKRRLTEIAIRFHQAPYTLFRGTDVERLHPNWMILRIQPDEGIALEFAAKRPGPTVTLDSVSMDFAYKSYFKMVPNTGYETLIYDCMIGDATLFQRADNIEAGWHAVQPILDAWANNPPQNFPNYAAGSNGPAAVDELLARDGRAWRPLD